MIISPHVEKSFLKIQHKSRNRGQLSQLDKRLPTKYLQQTSHLRVRNSKFSQCGIDKNIRQIYQWKIVTERPETAPHINSRLIFAKGRKLRQWSRGMVPDKWTHPTKHESRYMPYGSTDHLRMDQRPKWKTQNYTITRIQEVNLHDHGYGNAFLGTTTKSIIYERNNW